MSPHPCFWEKSRKKKTHRLVIPNFAESTFRFWSRMASPAPWGENSRASASSLIFSEKRKNNGSFNDFLEVLTRRRDVRRPRSTLQFCKWGGFEGYSCCFLLFWENNEAMSLLPKLLEASFSSCDQNCQNRHFLLFSRNNG